MKKVNSRVKALVSLAVLVTVAATVIINRSSNSHAQKIKVIRDPAEHYVPGRILVKFNDHILPAHARNIIAALGARDADEIPDIGVHILDLPYQANEKAFVQRFQEQPEVEFAELDRIVEPAEMTPNDPWYANWQWHLTKIQAPMAWSTTTGSSSITIAILDTGVDPTHEDLNSKLVPGWNVYNNNNDTRDVIGHGTHVAGTAGAASNNGMGVASVAWGCRIMPVRVSDASGYATYSNIASGLNWASAHGARVANVSYAVTSSSTVRTAAQSFQANGGVVAVSSGNNGTFDSSADNPYVLTIGATDRWDALYYYSNRGNNVDLTAPGDSFTTERGGGYTSTGGTSYSAPIVAGVAALILSANPSLTPTQVQGILKDAADDFGATGWDASYGYGRVNAARSVALAGGGPSPSPSPSPSPTVDTMSPLITITSPENSTTVSVNMSVYVSASDNIGVVKVELYVDGSLKTTSTSPPFTTKWNSKKANLGSHTFQTKAYDAAGNAGFSQLVTVYK